MGNEILSMRKLKHKKIAQLYEVYEDDAYVYLIFEYITGGDLQERIKSKKRFTEQEAANVMEQLLSILDYCHKNGVIHRDVKPRNIMIK